MNNPLRLLQPFITFFNFFSKNTMQDFSHIQTFEGHEHRVMALMYVDQEQPLCISGDSGGGIFVWGTSVPLGQEPLKKWYEQKDWRYSGIHALSSGNGYIYTGSGDKTIKAWLLQVIICLYHISKCTYQVLHVNKLSQFFIYLICL